MTDLTEAYAKSYTTARHQMPSMKTRSEMRRARAQRKAKDYDPNEPRDEGGKWTTGGGSGGGDTAGSIKPPSAEATAKAEGYEFVSSNTGNLDLKGAYEALSSPRHAMLTTASREIDSELGLRTTDDKAIGAWKDGAEDSMMTIVHGATWDQIVTGAAMKGHLGDQKAVLAFQQQEGGTAALAKWTTAGTYDDLESVHDELLKDGLAFHTLVAGPKGLTVYVADLDGSLAPAIEKAAKRYDSHVEIQFGRAEFIGTTKSDGTDREQRDSARQVYETVIKQSPVQGSTEIWNRIHNRWGEALDPANPHFERGVNGEPSAALVAFAKAESEKELPKAGIVPRVPGDAVSGYLTPDGTLININDYHSEVAEAAGTTLDALLKDGTARIYYYPGDYVGIEMHERPTAQEVNTLKAAVSRGRVSKLYIDHQLWRSQFRGGFEAKPGLTVRQPDLIQAINKVMPAEPKALAQHKGFIARAADDAADDEAGDTGDEGDNITEVELWPETGEDREDWMDRCVQELIPCIGEDNAVDVCTAKWTDSKKLGKKGFVTLAALDAGSFKLKIEPCGNACLACAGADAPFDARGHFIQDPETGRMDGSEPGPGHGEGEGSGAGEKPTRVSIGKRSYPIRDTSKEIDQARVNGAAIVNDDGTLSILHVTDDAARVKGALEKPPKDMAASFGNEGDDLGAGFYGSAAPQIWMNRSSSKWAFLSEISAEQKASYVGYIRSELDRQLNSHYINQNEFDRATRDLNYYADGKTDYIVWSAEQPYNIASWKPDVLSKLGISQTKLPSVVEIKMAGRFVDLTDGGFSQDDLKTLQGKGFDGAYTQGSFSYTPQLVLWNGGAIKAVKDWK